MGLFEVYQLWDIEPTTAKGPYFYDKDGKKYLDFYGGHAVISIGHSHPVYVERMTEQLKRIGFYSNAVVNRLQLEFAERLEKIAACPNYQLFLCNSGAEANENALKLASWVTGKVKILAFKNSFHGRTSAAVAVTDNGKLQAPLNRCHEVTFIPLNDVEALQKELDTRQYAAVIVEGIQGVGGIQIPDSSFLQLMQAACQENGTLMILDEVQSGCGRSGKYFAHQHAGVTPDIITMAKGIGNGFPLAALYIAPQYKAQKGMLGTTFGGNYLACTAGLAVLEVLEQEYLLNNAAALGNYLMRELQKIPGVKEVRGMGLMIGLETEFEQLILRRLLIEKYRVMTGYSGSHTLRLLPPLVITRKECDEFLESFRQAMCELLKQKGNKVKNVYIEEV